MIGFSASLFEQGFRQFARFVETQPQQEGRRFESFLSGYARVQEYYKTELHDEALRRLDVAHWRETDVGTGKILQKIIDAIEIKESEAHPRNNLLDWEGRWGGDDSCAHASLHEAKAHGTSRTAYEAALFDFYTGTLDPEEAMNEFIRYAGKKYPLLAYLFYLRDWERFMPIAPTYFEEGFERLGINIDGDPVRLVNKASWENYSIYNAALQLVREGLLGQGIEQVRLLDAHSFVYMLSRLDPTLPLRPLRRGDEEEPREPDPEAPLIDFEKWRAACRLNGKLAEEFVEREERRRLTVGGRADLSERVKIVSMDHLLGFDIHSFELDGTPRWLEVKSCRVEAGTVLFYLTENERRKSRELSNYWYCLVFNVRSDTPTMQAVSAEDFDDRWLSPVVHEVRCPHPQCRV